MAVVTTLCILITAGAMLVIQNLLMVKITSSASTVLVTLVLNSSVGLLLLAGTLLIRNGLGGFAEIADSFKPWHLLPGVLGSFFVFAGILGYRQLGPSITIATLVATQLITGLLADSFKPGSFAPRVDPMAIVGVILLVAGVLLIVRGKG